MSIDITSGPGSGDGAEARLSFIEHSRWLAEKLHPVAARIRDLVVERDSLARRLAAAEGAVERAAVIAETYRHNGPHLNAHAVGTGIADAIRAALADAGGTQPRDGQGAEDKR